MCKNSITPQYAEILLSSLPAPRLRQHCLEANSITILQLAKRCCARSEHILSTIKEI